MAPRSPVVIDLTQTGYFPDDRWIPNTPNDHPAPEVRRRGTPRYAMDTELYGSLQAIRALLMMTGIESESDPVSVNNLLKTTATQQLAALQNDFFPLPRYQECYDYFTVAKPEWEDVANHLAYNDYFSENLLLGWPVLNLTLRYKASKKQIEFAKDAITAGATTAEALLEPMHNAWIAIADEYINQNENFYTNNHFEKHIPFLKTLFGESMSRSVNDIPEDRIEKAMYRVMADVVIQAYKTAGIIAP